MCLVLKGAHTAGQFEHKFSILVVYYSGSNWSYIYPKIPRPFVMEVYVWNRVNTLFLLPLRITVKSIDNYLNIRYNVSLIWYFGQSKVSVYSCCYNTTYEVRVPGKYVYNKITSRVCNHWNTYKLADVVPQYGQEINSFVKPWVGQIPHFVNNGNISAAKLYFIFVTF